MKYLFTFALTVSSLFFAACKSTSPTAPDTSKGTPTAIGTPVGTPTTATIDASGGSLMSSDGRLEVIIPANALSAATNISIQPVTNEAPQGTGLSFSLTPHGQQFSQPVTLRFHYKPDDLLGSDIEALEIATQKDDRIWYRYNAKVIDQANGTISVQSPSFSVKSLYQSLKIHPTEATIKVNTSQAVNVNLIQPAEDVDANDELTPLGTAMLYPNPEEIKWTLNGSTIGTPEDGLLTALGNTPTATYTAPSTIDNMTSNPVAVTATVDIIGSSKHYLISNITVIEKAGASGTVSLTASLLGSRTHTNGGIVEVKSEEGSANLVYNLPNVPILDGGNNLRDANWDDAAFDGTSNQISNHSQSYEVICSGGKRTITNRDRTEITYSGGKQVTGMGLTIAEDGTYTIAIGPSTSLTAATSALTTWNNSCDLPEQINSSSGTSPVPFAYYFIPYIGGNGAKTVGKIDPAHPNTIKGIYHGTAEITMFSFGTETINLPFDYTISWDITLTK